MAVDVQRPVKPPKRPLMENTVNTCTVTNANSDTKRHRADQGTRYFEAVWRKQTQRKNKTWDGDGFVVLTATGASFRLDESDKFKERARCAASRFTTDGVFTMGAYELEVTGEVVCAAQIGKIKQFAKSGALRTGADVDIVKPATPKKIAPARLVSTQFKQVLPKSEQTVKPRKNEPLYDPNAEGAVVMKKLHADDTDVVIDPFLSKSLRPHQVKGVKFLYECVMDLRFTGGHGALLADDMGLGKTLQTIALIWTLLKQSPRGFDKPVVSKVLIACPVTLVGNWKREFKKWLPMNRINVLTLHSKNTLTNDRQDLKNFARAKVYHVLIMGYEKILNMKDELAQSQFDLLICDEGHRLKNNSNKTLQALNSLEITKKVLLSGTPIQNDLSEFFNIIDFVNPGVLGTFNQFKRNYMTPILRSRETNCHDPALIQLGEDKSQELITLTKPFILRRTASVISNHLPPRADVVLFCPPTRPQIRLFNQVLSSQKFNHLVDTASTMASSLGLITMFKKICNSPSLITSDKLFNEISDKSSSVVGHSTSGKIVVFLELLKEIHRSGEKVVVVSNYTQTLDILQTLLDNLNFTYSRLDGSTPNKDRDPLVNKFNISPQKVTFAFLLSSKSGGVGLNLIGASRLILFDNDWNPSVDLQVMARIHRDGQKRPVFIYRLITTGCIDEKIFQRQLMKNNLSDKFLDNKSNSKDNVFDMTDLKDLFSVQEGTKCNTHDLIECSCEGIGEDLEGHEADGEDNTEMPKVPFLSRQGSWISAREIRDDPDPLDKSRQQQKSVIKKCLQDYKHFDPSRLSSSLDTPVGDPIVESIISRDSTLVTYILTKVNKPSI